jgi:hypothetical protein
MSSEALQSCRCRAGVVALGAVGILDPRPAEEDVAGRLREPLAFGDPLGMAHECPPSYERPSADGPDHLARQIRVPESIEQAAPVARQRALLAVVPTDVVNAADRR